jgi:DNA modification methylase
MTAAAWRNRIIGTGEEAPDQLVANPANWRTHPAGQRNALRGSLGEVGWVQQVMVNRRTGYVIDGHARIEEALSRGEPTVPVLYVDLEPEEEALVLAVLDPIGAMATRDDERLHELLSGIAVDDAGLTTLLADLAPLKGTVGLTDPDDAPPLGDESNVHLGDLFALGDHRLMCGDSTKAEDVARLMDGQRAAAMVTDPPYGVAYRDTGSGAWGPEKLARKRAGALKPRFDAIADDELVGEALTAFWTRFLVTNIAHLDHGAPVYCCFASLRAPEVFAAYDAAGLEPRAELVWVKSRPGFNFAHYKHQHEPMLYGAQKGQPANWYGDRSQVSTLHVASESGRDYQHPTQKPVELLQVPIRNSSRASEVIVDPFSGSGSTIIAAEQLGRRCFAMELDPRYVAVAIKRWEDFTGRTSERLP